MPEEDCPTSENDAESLDEESSKQEPKAEPQDRGIEEMWPIIPTDLQRKILAPISLKSIFRLRCVNKFFNNVMFPNEAHNSFGAAAMSHTPAFYFKSTCFPLSVEWFTFDFQSNLWQKMKKFVTTMRVTTMGMHEGIFLRQLYCFAKKGLLNQFVFPAGGLLCILHQSMREVGDDSNDPVKFTQTLFPFIVWNPLTNKWRELPPCKYNVCRNYSISDSSFIHAFRDNATRSYKILCTLKDYKTTGGEMPLTTEIYDSRTRVWKECATYDGQRMRSSFGSGQGVYCNGVVYFQLWRPRSWILFCFDVAREEWSEEESEQRSLRLFEWNGMLMTALPPLDSWNKYELAYVYRRDRAEKKWVDVGIAIPAEVRREFSRGEEIVAAENYLCLSGYDRHGTFKTAVFDKEENLWRLPLSAPSCKDLPSCELRFVFRYTPSFTVEP